LHGNIFRAIDDGRRGVKSPAAPRKNSNHYQPIMKTNRILSFLAVCGLCITLFSCEKENGGNGSNTGGKTSSDFTVTPSGLTSVSSTGGTGTITIKTTGTPTVSSDQSWCTTKQSTKNSLGYIYDVTVAASNETDDRSATITVTVGSSSKTVTVTQLSTDGLVISSSKNVSVKAAGETITVNLSANGDFDVTIGKPWITAADTKASMTSQTRTFKVAKNPVAKERSTTISFTLNDITEAVTVTQEAGDGSSMAKSAKEIAKEMYPGWNLGNTLEAGISNNK